MAIFNITKRAFARERLTVTSGAVKTLTAATYDDVANAETVPSQQGTARRKASAARVVLESGSGDMHFSEEGTDPTSGTAVTDVGTVVGARDVITLESYEAIRKFKAKALTAVDAIIEIVYYR